jgi:hypothetical protein
MQCGICGGELIGHGSGLNCPTCNPTKMPTIKQLVTDDLIGQVGDLKQQLAARERELAEADDSMAVLDETIIGLRLTLQDKEIELAEVRDELSVAKGDIAKWKSAVPQEHPINGWPLEGIRGNEEDGYKVYYGGFAEHGCRVWSLPEFMLPYDDETREISVTVIDDDFESMEGMGLDVFLITEEHLGEIEQQRAALSTRLRSAEDALREIMDGPQPIADYLLGIRCGVEDRDYQNAGYDAAEYAYEEGLDYCSEIARAHFAAHGGADE